VKILNINPIFQVKISQANTNSKKENNKFVTNTQYSNQMFAYRDYNISFGGRTPENFYEQDFNRNNMPQTMKDYLYYDYEQRQHIPPEQMMSEVFKYIELADSIDDVKNIYPKEDLFENLHENTINSRKGILSEIKVARDLSDTPLLKDGSDDFGLYLLKKIYLEGKTLKEISKDFLENDINEEYKGFITEPVGYSTLSAYGIKYPNNAFWHSFINTRDEYKKFFVTLPKNSVIPGVNTGSHKTSSASKADGKADVEEKPRKRRYTIKSHRKTEIQKDLIDKKSPDMETVKKTVVKRFGKGDPEASFIVKYMSPIMTVAAERAHMSEEMKLFNEYEQTHGKFGNGKTMFERFWKFNPQMLKVFSAAVTDTIDMFEDVYSDGGMIAINSDLEKITPSSANQKTIDYVNPEFLELLSYSQNIEPERNKKYELHDELQKQWDAHFAERYGNPIEQPQESDNIEPEPKRKSEITLEEILEKAKKENKQIFILKAENGQNVYITIHLDDVFKDEIRKSMRLYPTKLAGLYVNQIMKDKNISDRYKLTVAVRRENLAIDDPQIMDDDEFQQITQNYQSRFSIEYFPEELAASAAMADFMVNKYSKELVPASIYKAYMGDFEMIAKNDDVNLREEFLKNKPEIDRLYDLYTKPLSENEIHRISSLMTELLVNYKPVQENNITSDATECIKMLQEIAKTYKFKKEFVQTTFTYYIKSYPYVRSLMNKRLDREYKQAKFEQIMAIILHDMINHSGDSNGLTNLINKSTYERHKMNLSPKFNQRFQNIVNNLNPMAKMIYEYSDSDLEKLQSGYELVKNHKKY